VSKIIGIIPARSGSESVKNKNIRTFHGKPLIAWTIECALASRLDRVIVSTNDENIQNIAKEHGAEAPFLRPESISDNYCGIEPVLKHTYEYLKKEENYEADIIVMLLPTSPFRETKDLNLAIQMYLDDDLTSVVSVIKAEANMNPHWMLVENSNSINLFNGNTLKDIQDRRQDLPDVFIRNDFVYVLDPKNLYESKSNLYGERVNLYKISEQRYDIDINSEKDFYIAEAIFSKLKLNE
jgi:N-acylneuraminate cytidylyltransferase